MSPTPDDPRAHELARITARFADGTLSAPIALMQLLIVAENLDLVTATVHPHPELAKLLADNREGCTRICAMLASGLDSPTPSPTIDSGLASTRRLFDFSVSASEESSVALYSLGNPQLLASATTEIIDLLDSWGLIAPDIRSLEIGCGIGRLQAALAPRLQEARGIDLSPNMIAAARRRCATLPNAHFDITDGRDLFLFPNHRFDLLFAVDSFPYLVQSGMDLVETHFAEASRVLVPRGHFVLLNFSYRDDLPLDRQDIARLAATHNFTVDIDGTLPFKLWDGAAWRLQKQT